MRSEQLCNIFSSLLNQSLFDDHQFLSVQDFVEIIEFQQILNQKNDLNQITNKNLETLDTCKTVSPPPGNGNQSHNIINRLKIGINSVGYQITSLKIKFSCYRDTAKQSHSMTKWLLNAFKFFNSGLTKIHSWFKIYGSQFSLTNYALVFFKYLFFLLHER